MTALLIVALVLLTLLGLPLFIALAGGSLLATYNAGLDPALLIVELNRLAASPYLASIPLFTFAGVVLAAGGAPERMIQLFNACVGWMPGGMAAVAIGSCAAFGGIPGADPNPTGAVSVADIVKNKPVVNVPGCPPIPMVMTAVLAQFLTFGTLPELDKYGRPMTFYGTTIHDRCYRRPFYEQGKEMYYTRYGQLELSCANCHEDNYGNMIRADHLSQGHSIVEHHTLSVQILCRANLGAAAGHQLHNRSDVFQRRKDLDLHPRLVDLADCHRIG